MTSTATLTRTRPAAELAVGDIIVFLGRPHRIARIEPPAASTLAILPNCVGHARSADGWGITLTHPGMAVEVG